MKALRKTARGEGHVELVGIAAPRPAPGEVLIQVAFAGICGTDLHILHDRFRDLHPPVTLGHECSGVIAEVGPGVSEWEAGDQVIIESAADWCGTCTACLEGSTQLCSGRVAHGIGADGGFAEYMVVRQTGLHRLPGGVSLREAALTEPLACAVHAVYERARLSPGSTVLVTGPGVIGLSVLQVARSTGAEVIVCGTRKDHARLEVARALGARRCIEVDDSGRLQLSPGEGPLTVDAGFECSGSVSGAHICIETVRNGATVVQVGVMGKRVELDYDRIGRKEIDLLGSYTHNHRSWQKAVEMMSPPGLDLDPLISGEFPLADWESAFQAFERGLGIRYVLRPGE